LKGLPATDINCFMPEEETRLWVIKKPLMKKKMISPILLKEIVCPLILRKNSSEILPVRSKE